MKSEEAFTIVTTSRSVGEKRSKLDNLKFIMEHDIIQTKQKQ